MTVKNIWGRRKLVKSQVMVLLLEGPTQKGFCGAGYRANLK